MRNSIDLSFLRTPAVVKRIAVATLVCAVAATLYGLLAPKWYESVVTVVPAKQQKPGISSMLGMDLGGLAAGVDASFGGADGPRIAAVLQSIQVTDALVDKFDLRTRYGEKYQETARAALWQHCQVKLLPKPNLVQLVCEDKDPRFVQQMLAYFAEYGNEVFRRVGESSASEEVRFLEKHVVELRQQSDEASTRMRDFQEQHQIVDLDTQAKAVVSALAALNSQRISKQMELNYARTFSARDEPTMHQLQSELSVVDDQLQDLAQVPAVPADNEKPGRRGKQAAGVFPPALAVPKLRAEFEKLYRDRKVAEASLVFALERLEAAKAAEARNASTFLVLDPPTLPTRPSWPRPGKIVFISMVLGLAAALAFEYRKNLVRTAPGHSARPVDEAPVAPPGRSAL